MIRRSESALSNCSTSAVCWIAGQASSRAANASVSRSDAPCCLSRGLLLLDEPLGALDEGRKLEILPYLVRLRDEGGIPMVYVSHDAAELRQLATQIVMLKRGHITAFGGVKVLDGCSSPDLIPGRE